jgi:arsenate reductase
LLLGVNEVRHLSGEDRASPAYVLEGKLMTKQKVLFLCTGNSARSQIAEALVNARLDGWQAVSAGTHPAERVNPYALRALAEIGIHMQGAQPKHVETFLRHSFDLVVTVCDDANENCPVWLGRGKRMHVAFPDPARATGTDDEIMAAFRAVRDDIALRLIGRLDTLAESV